MPQVYVDPASGETVDALEAFRRHLGRLVEEGWIELAFSTVREIKNRSFFRGPTYRADGTWRSNEGLTAEVSMLKVPRTEPRLDGNPNQPDVLPSANQIDVFKERAVAATGWHLAIPVSGAGSVPIEKLDDIEIYFYHWAFNRQ